MLEDPELTGSLREAVEAVETALNSGNLDELRQWIDSQSNISWLTGNYSRPSCYY
jgi:hypothetical protein